MKTRFNDKKTKGKVPIDIVKSKECCVKMRKFQPSHQFLHHSCGLEFNDKKKGKK